MDPSTFIVIGINHITSVVYLDEIFGEQNFRNDITWVRSTNPKGSQHKSRYDVFTDTLLFYTKNVDTELNLDVIRIPLTEEELLEKYHRQDEKGRFYDGPIVSSASMGARPISSL